MNKTLLGLLLVVGVCLVAAGRLPAQETQKEEKPAKPSVGRQIKEVEGEVSAITKRSISVVYSRDKENGTEDEISLPYDDKLMVEHKQSLADIQTGDTVMVRYIDETVDYGDKQENSFKAVMVRYLRPAGENSPYKRKADVVQEVAQEDAQALTLKGAKQ